MSQGFDTAKPLSRAVILGVQVQGVSDAEFASSLEEISRLGKTLGLQIIGRVTQKRTRLAPGVVVGEGKLKELARWTGGPGKTVEIAERIYKNLSDTNIEVLIDDRDERAGVKFKDADLIGVPVQVIIGEKNLKEDLIEIKDRRTKEAEKVRIEEAVREIKRKITTGY